MTPALERVRLSLMEAQRCQRHDPGNRRDKDAEWCAAALTLCHCSCGGG